MSIQDALNEARARRVAIEASVKAAGTPASAISTAASSGGIDTLGRAQQNMTQHAEQYKHYTGYVYAIIRVIQSRISGQPVRIARRAKDSQPDDPHHAGTPYWAGTENTPVLPTSSGDAAPTQPQPALNQQAAYQAWKAAKLAQWKARMPDGVKALADNAEPLDEHRLLRLFAAPNPIMVKSMLMAVTVASLELTGKAHWWLDVDEEGREQIWPLPSSWCEAVHEEGKLFGKWKVNVPGVGEAVEVTGDQLAYFYYPDPGNPLGAMSPLQALARTVVVDEAMEESQRRAFSNGLNPGLALIVGRLPEVSGVVGPEAARPVLTKEQRNVLINAVKNQYRGVINNEEPLILDGLIQDAKRINATVREMDFLSSQQASRGRLCQGWGVNPISMGEMGATRAESAVADDHMLQNVINPRIEMISEVMTAWLPAFFCPGEDLLVYLEKAVSQDLEHELNVETSMSDRGAMSINEWRGRRGLPPIQNGDVAYVGGQAVPVVPAAPEPVRSQRPIPDDPVWVKASDPGLQPVEVFQPTPILLPSSGWAEPPGGEPGWHGRPPEPDLPQRRPTQDPVVDAWLAQQDRLEKDLHGALRDGLVSIGELACRRLEDAHRKGAVFQTPEAALSHLADQLDSERGGWSELLRRAAWPALTRAVIAGAALEWALALRRTTHRGSKELPSVLLKEARKVAASLAAEPYWDTVFQTAAADSTKSVQLLADLGIAGLDLVTRAVRGALGIGPAARKAIVTARTEATAALNAGQDLVRRMLSKAGRPKRKRWVATLDDRTRHTHAEAHGQIVGPDEPFLLGGLRCAHPGDPSLPPGERINCRCVAVSVEE